MFNTDVIGRVLAVSNAARVLTSSGTLKWKRIIHLGDFLSSISTLTYYLNCKLYNLILLAYLSTHPVIFLIHKTKWKYDRAITVGSKSSRISGRISLQHWSMKCIKESSYFLSGTAACRWYINENDIQKSKYSKRGTEICNSIPPKF
jgi:hypothetical protein